MSILIGFVSASTFNYVANKNYVFKTINKNKYILLKYFMLLLLILVLRILFVRIFEEYLMVGLIYISIIFSSLITMTINFYLSKYFVFREIRNGQ